MCWISLVSLYFWSACSFFVGGKQTVSSTIYKFYIFRKDMICQCLFSSNSSRQRVTPFAHQSMQGLVTGYSCHFFWCVCIPAETHCGTRCSQKKSWGSEKKPRCNKSQEQSAVQRSENLEGTDHNPAGERKTRWWAHRCLTGIALAVSPLSINDEMWSHLKTQWHNLSVYWNWWITLWWPEVSQLAKALLCFRSGYVKAAEQEWQLESNGCKSCIETFCRMLEIGKLSS